MSENLNTSSVTIGSDTNKVNKSSNNAMHNHEEEPASKRTKTEDNNYDGPESTPKSRALRLEQNRRAAKESRRRKKMMIAGMYCVLSFQCWCWVLVVRFVSRGNLACQCLCARIVKMGHAEFRVLQYFDHLF